LINEIYNLIRKNNGKLDALDIAEKLNMSYHDVREITKKLTRENKIEWKDDSLWIKE
jgi:Mn-dependent DtxR family transcriptional regulator